MKGRKTRNLCFDIENRKFSCQNSAQSSVVIPSDQLEALRLVDFEGKSQIEAALIMGVSRGTIQRLCIRARKSITASLMYGYDIIIEPGHSISVRSDCQKMCMCQKMKERILYEQ